MRIEYICEDGSRTLALWPSMALQHWLGRSRPLRPIENPQRGQVRGRGEQWAAEQKRRWEKSKFFKLWQEEKKAGCDPHKAFEDRGWEP